MRCRDGGGGKGDESMGKRRGPGVLVGIGGSRD